ncbi:MFS transporter [Kordiimonas laminariae]|uniref:MFS transporter n=1 Tax=Kordiimonas laminariae TaxID=2917717 RepID=UPI001FF55EF2|nr:MFS transporter [Kordiimonas laminariae]MCK0070783.1 MFS transporter [Kordiimonas laminariae]
MSQENENQQTTTVKDVEQLGIFAAIASLSYVFWICGGMEMVERLAFYGVRQSTGLYVTDSVANGGLGLVESDLGLIFLIWAIVQTFVPVLTGGISDRIGYKETIFASTIFKILGYLLMGFFPSFWGFASGAVVLAFGTGIFKPGLQGTISKSTGRHNSSMAWGIFYQTVNIGGALGPMVAVALRQLSWDYLFFACAAIISLNFILLLMYKEPDKEERLAHRAKVKAGEVKEESLWRDSIKELSNPVLIWYVVLFSGFWFMLWTFWDVAPLYFRDWVDTTTMVSQIFGEGGTDSGFWKFFWGMNQEGTAVMPEGLVNINAILIMFTCFIVAGLSGKIRATNSMAIGTFLASSALIIFGGFNFAWIIFIGVVIFSFGEMLSSPKSSEYLANIAPREKKAMYLGFTQLPIGLGWTIESYLGPYLYGEFSSKEQISRKMLLENGMTEADVAAVPIGEAFDKLLMLTGQSAGTLTEQMYAANAVGTVWYVMGIVGLISALGMYAYGKWTYRVAKMQEA